MTQNPSFRDIEALSAYLDGQLKPSEAASLERRLASNPDLQAILVDLRQARRVLRQLPQRRAPRNFTLSTQMVGQKPPLPRVYPVLRFASALATLLLFLSFAANFMAPRLAMQAVSVPYGIGGGGGGADLESQGPAPAMEAPAESEAPAAEQPEVVEEPAAPEAAALPAATPTPPVVEDAFRAQATALPTMEALGQAQEKAADAEQPGTGEGANQTFSGSTEPEAEQPPVPILWQVALAALAVVNLFILLLLRRNAASKWRKSK